MRARTDRTRPLVARLDLPAFAAAHGLDDLEALRSTLADGGSVPRRVAEAFAAAAGEDIAQLFEGEVGEARQHGRAPPVALVQDTARALSARRGGKP